MLLFRYFCSTCGYITMHQVSKRGEDYYLRECTFCGATRQLPFDDGDQRELLEVEAMIQDHSRVCPELKEVFAPGDRVVPPPQLLADLLKRENRR